MSTDWPPAAGAGPAHRAAAAVRLAVTDLQVVATDSGADVVSDVSFEVRAGEVLGLVGESGSGKTTWRWPCSGTPAAACGSAPARCAWTAWTCSGCAPRELRRGPRREGRLRAAGPGCGAQPHACGSARSCAEAFKVHPGLAGDPAERVTEIMQEASLEATPEMLRRYPHQLSGGQQQRVTLAMAFACRPSTDRAGRADHRPRRDHPASRARHRPQHVRLLRGRRRLRQP